MLFRLAVEASLSSAPRCNFGSPCDGTSATAPTFVDNNCGGNFLMTAPSAVSFGDNVAAAGVGDADLLGLPLSGVAGDFAALFTG